VEIYLEPVVPPPVLQVVGTSPTAEAIASLAPTVGMEVVRDEVTPETGGVLATIVSTHGGEEAKILRSALDAGVGSVGLVCSRTRAPQVLAELRPNEEERRGLRPHVGLEIGARTPGEIALSVLAAVVREVRLEGLTPTPGAGTPSVTETVVDPVCGMTVTPVADTPHAVVDGVGVWFCGPACRDAYVGARA
jgi:xanthine dehydrogenase accessory factor